MSSQNAPILLHKKVHGHMLLWIMDSRSIGRKNKGPFHLNSMLVMSQLKGMNEFFV